MKINHLRASSINTYDSCNFQYYLNCSIGIESEPGSAALKGTISHAVLEILARAKKASQKTGKPPKGKRIDTKYLLDICWKKHTTQNPNIELTDKDYSFCHKQIQNALSIPYLNVLNLKIISIEHQFEIEVKKPEFKIKKGEYLKLRGTIDLLFEEDSETIHILDYKTGKSTDWVTGKEKDAEKLQTDTQLRMYDLAVKLLFPKYKYRIFTLFFTQEIKPITIAFEKDTWKETLKEFSKKFKEIQQNNSPTRLYDKDIGSRWKCRYVCQFGKLAVKYQAKTGEVHYEYLRNNKDLFIPDQVLIGNTTYYLLPGEPETHCDKIYRKFKKLGAENLEKELTPLTINTNVSRRNDFANAKLERKVIR